MYDCIYMNESRTQIGSDKEQISGGQGLGAGEGVTTNGRKGHVEVAEVFYMPTVLVIA